MLPSVGLTIRKADGFADYHEDRLARDASLIVAYPEPIGTCSFCVDDVLQITVGDKILYSTEAENNPTWLTEASALLLRARRELGLLLPGSSQHTELSEDVERLSAQLVAYYQGRKRVKAERVVIYVDPARNLIAVDKPFTHGYKPRVLGAVTRILGFTEDSVNEPLTEKIHKEAKNLYGSDWESEWKSIEALPPVS